MADVIDITSKKTKKAEPTKHDFDMKQAVGEFLGTIDKEIKNNEKFAYSILVVGDTDGNITVEAVGMISPAEMSWAGVSLQQMAIRMTNGS